MDQIINRFDYLIKYVKNKTEEITHNRNVFFSVSEEQIKQAEEELGVSFPGQLKSFYRQIGYGFLNYSNNTSPKYDATSFTNLVISPIAIVKWLKEVEENQIFAEEYGYDLLEKGDIPFFNWFDYRYFIMKCNSSDPNIVWDIYGGKVADSFNEFIWRMYYEDPNYFEKILDKQYENT